MTEGIVEFGDWEKLDLRVAQIKSAEDIDGADRLYKLKLDVGEIGESKSEISTDSPEKSNQRIVCAGIKEFYSKEDLVGKKVIYFSNLKPRMLRGIESSGMLLAASSKDHSQVILISPEKDIENGSRVG